MKNWKHYAQMAVLFTTGAACGYMVAGVLVLAVRESMGF